MIEGKTYYLSFPAVQRGSFEIHELDKDPIPQEPVYLGEASIRYIADGPLAGACSKRSYSIFMGT